MSPIMRTSMSTIAPSTATSSGSAASSAPSTASSRRSKRYTAWATDLAKNRGVLGEEQSWGPQTSLVGPPFADRADPGRQYFRAGNSRRQPLLSRQLPKADHRGPHIP